MRLCSKTKSSNLWMSWTVRTAMFEVVGPNHLRLQHGQQAAMLLCYYLATIQLGEPNHDYASPQRTP